jgi:hypothetical protein
VIGGQQNGYFLRNQPQVSVLKDMTLNTKPVIASFKDCKSYKVLVKIDIWFYW